MKTIRQLLREKGNHIWSVEADDSVFNAIKLMADKGIGALLVTREGMPVGIVSERDYARKVILKGRSSKETPVADIMTSEVIYGHPDMSIEEGLALMTEKRIRHLPIKEGETLQGIVSIGDLVKAIIAEQRFLIEQLENYIRQ